MTWPWRVQNYQCRCFLKRNKWEVTSFKVRTFWEAHKKLCNLPHALYTYLVNVQTMRKIFSNCVWFSESPNFNDSNQISYRYNTHAFILKSETGCSKQFKWTLYFFVWSDRAVLVCTETGTFNCVCQGRIILFRQLTMYGFDSSQNFKLFDIIKHFSKHLYSVCCASLWSTSEVILIFAAAASWYELDFALQKHCRGKILW